MIDLKKCVCHAYGAWILTKRTCVTHCLIQKSPLVCFPAFLSSREPPPLGSCAKGWQESHLQLCQLFCCFHVYSSKFYSYCSNSIKKLYFKFVARFVYLFESCTERDRNHLSPAVDRAGPGWGAGELSPGSKSLPPGRAREQSLRMGTPGGVELWELQGPGRAAEVVSGAEFCLPLHVLPRWYLASV